MRARITALAVVIATVVLALASLVVVLVVQSQLRADLDRALEQRVDQIAAAVVDDPDAAVANSNDEDRFAQVLDAEGRVVAATSNVDGEPPLAPLPEGDRSASTRGDLPLEDDAYRVLVRRVPIEGLRGGSGTVIVGENVDDVDDGVRALIVTLLLVVPAAVAVLAGAVWWLVGRTLRPVEAIRTEVDGIGLGQLDHRVPAPGTGDEIDRLAETMNAMLARLEASAADQRRFVADASHELRTPLARLRTQFEVDLADPRADLRATVREGLRDVDDMQAIVDDLLFLARLDAGAAAGRFDRLDLDAIVAEEVARARTTTDRSIDTSAVAPAVVRGDGHQLARLVRNLLANATRHARERVVVSVREQDDGVVLTVADDGPGIPPADRERVFERFVRLDDARTGNGTGLGLAIARDIAALHGGTVVAAGGTGGAELVVHLPAG